MGVAEREIERLHLKDSSRSFHIALEDLNFKWNVRDVQEFRRMWEEGLSIWDIARAFDRDPDEVVLLIMDQSRKGDIKPRKNGIWGRRCPSSLQTKPVSGKN